MKKSILISGIALLAFSKKANAQIGINTANPNATLDITAKNATGTSKNVDGLLIPRVDRQRAQSMASVPVSTLIYIDNATTGSQTGTATNIDTAGYYYYNGTVWVKLNSSAPAVNNIYNSDGTLTANRTVTQGNNTLSFKANSVNAFSINNAFSVDAANNRIGIGTLAPKNYLHITEPGKTSNMTVSYIKGQAITATDSPGIYFENLSNTVDNKVFKLNYTSNSANDGYLNFQSVSDNAQTTVADIMAITSKGKVGIGTTTPETTLEINSKTNNVSGLKLTKLTSSTPVGTGQAIGVDSNGNVITLPNPTATGITAVLDSSINDVGYAVNPAYNYNVNDNRWTIVPSTSQSLTIPPGGKALFINFMLGVDYQNNPPGSGYAYYTAKLFIDGSPTNVFLTTQESGPGGTQAQFNLSTVKFLSACQHTIDVRMGRTYNNGTTSGSDMSCEVMSMSINASYIN